MSGAAPAPSGLVAALTGLAVATAFLHVRAELRGPAWQVYVGKPATTLAIVAIAWLAVPADPAYRQLVLAGLVFSLAGDVFLMLPSDRFREGLASFLVAHLLYVAAFSRQGGPAPAALAPFALYGAAVFAWLYPGLGAMRWPAAAYLVSIVAMAWQAGAQWLAVGDARSALALAGATLFVASDSVLAVNRFRGPVPLAPAFVLGTYYPAQWLIARSI